MGWIHHQTGAYALASPFYTRAIVAKRRLLGSAHPKTLTTMCNLYVFACDQGDYDEAERTASSLLATLHRVQGPKHPQTLDATGGLAVVLRHQGKLEEARRAARTSIDGRNEVLGPSHPWTWPPVAHWGYILTLCGDLEEGETVIRTSRRAQINALARTCGPKAVMTRAPVTGVRTVSSATLRAQTVNP